jgi:hypothetical protein
MVADRGFTRIGVMLRQTASPDRSRRETAFGRSFCMADYLSTRTRASLRVPGCPKCPADWKVNVRYPTANHSRPAQSSVI